MGLSERLQALDQRVLPRKLRRAVGGARRSDEAVEQHLRYLAARRAFASDRVAEDVLAVLDRVKALEARVAELEQRR